MKHKHAEMIKAKVDNMELVLLVSNSIDKVWDESDYQFPTSDYNNYFLCHPKHANAVRHVLNGGEIELKGEYHEREVEAGEIGAWSKGMWYMREDMESRIKPKKEKRWIVVCPNSSYTIYLYESQQDAEAQLVEFKELIDNAQVIEIEIEI